MDRVSRFSITGRKLDPRSLLERDLNLPQSAAFIPRPNRLRFETQEQAEKIYLLLRRHPIVNVPWIILAFLMLVFPLAVSDIANLDFMPSGFQTIFTLMWYLLTFAFAFERFLSWFFNVNIITDERVVSIDFPNMLNRSISQAKIDRIQEINMHTGGYIRSFLNFGDVLIQTAGELPNIRFEDIPTPERVVRILDDLTLQEELEVLEGRVR